MTSPRDRVEALIRLATDPGVAVEEARTASMQAVRLIKQHGILNGHAPASPEPKASRPSSAQGPLDDFINVFFRYPPQYQSQSYPSPGRCARCEKRIEYPEKWKYVHVGAVFETNRVPVHEVCTHDVEPEYRADWRKDAGKKRHHGNGLDVRITGAAGVIHTCDTCGKTIDPESVTNRWANREAHPNVGRWHIDCPPPEPKST